MSGVCAMSKAVDKWVLGGAEAPPNISELSFSYNTYYKNESRGIVTYACKAPPNLFVWVVFFSFLFLTKLVCYAFPCTRTWL